MRILKRTVIVLWILALCWNGVLAAASVDSPLAHIALAKGTAGMGLMAKSCSESNVQSLSCENMALESDSPPKGSESANSVSSFPSETPSGETAGKKTGSSQSITYPEETPGTQTGNSEETDSSQSGACSGIIPSPEISTSAESGSSQTDISSEETPDSPTEDSSPSHENPLTEESPDNSSSVETLPPEDLPDGSSPQESHTESYTVSLDNLHIQDGQHIYYTTISSENLGNSIPEGYYPGDLLVEVTGAVVIEAGGSLTIGTLSLGGPEKSPILSFSQSGQIIVKAGGQLILTDTILSPSKEDLCIIQEPGGSVVLQMTQVDPQLIQWSGPLVNNLYTAPDDLWLTTGTPLTTEQLPSTMNVSVENKGTEEDTLLLLAWNLDEYNGQINGELTLTGNFLTDTGQILTSMLPLKITVHWYSPEKLIVSSAVWKGETVPTVQLTVENLPEFVTIWGEVSADHGATWTRWESEDEFFVAPVESKGNACIFVLPDETPRMFRIKAEDSWKHLYWQSEEFYLHPEEQDDSGGDRGGSVSPISPDRQPDATENLEENAPSGTDAQGDWLKEIFSSWPVTEVFASMEVAADEHKPEVSSQPQSAPSKDEESPSQPIQNSVEAEKSGQLAEGSEPHPQAAQDFVGTEPTVRQGRAQSDTTEYAPETTQKDESSSNSIVFPDTETPDSQSEPSQEEPALTSALPSPAEPLTPAAQGASLSVTAQVLLVILGFGVCAAVSMIIAGFLHFPKKK